MVAHEWTELACLQVASTSVHFFCLVVEQWLGLGSVPLDHVDVRILDWFITEDLRVKKPVFGVQVICVSATAFVSLLFLLLRDF